MRKILKLALALLLVQLNSLVNCQCWIGAYGRGVGTVLTSCKSTEDKDGALCYPKCRDGYKGVGPVCWEICPSGYTDTGLFCTQWASTYGKGCCCTIFTKKCCNSCKPGYKDYGCTCTSPLKSLTKKSYTRGAGTPLGCGENSEKDGALCYPYCKANYKGIGPVCWHKGCSGAYPNQCGTLCTTNSKECQKIISDNLSSSVDVIKSMGELIIKPDVNAALDFFSSTTGIASSLINDVCGYPNKKATACIRSINNSTLKLSSCQGENNVECGLFCSSSKIVCIKATTQIVSSVASMASLIADPTKGVSEEQMRMAEEFLKKFPAEKLVQVLKNSNSLNEIFQDVPFFYAQFTNFISVTQSLGDTQC